MAVKLLSIIFFLFLLNLSSPLSAIQTPVSSAIDILSDSGFFSMSLTLQVTVTALNLSESPKLTIFAPSDVAFSESGQPSLLDLRYQVSPARIPGESLRNLPHGAKIPTLRSDISLIVTGSSESGGENSINNVVVQDSAIFDDGYLVIYGTDEFFKPFSQISISPIFAPKPKPNANPDSSSSSSPSPSPSSSPKSSNSSILGSPNSSIPDFEFHVLSPNSGSNLPNSSFPRSTVRSSPILPNNLSGSDTDTNVFELASAVLTSRGYVIMGTFLDLQLESSSNQTRLTVFAPVDDAITESAANFSDYSTIFRGHVVQRLLTWNDLKELDGERSVLHSARRGFEIELSWSGDILLLNGAPIVFPDLYVNAWIAVHGLNRMILPQSKQDFPMGESFSELDGGDEDESQDSAEFRDYGAR
ncbi:PREDICTED: putative fasciclin-like arabinogalactan protein 20 [Tarenaya hassleriana]|uniref:putative fasciclin-like arabinogalactan protein 20 n=1 Tax=Tarenaya hassleriana TaxID=28532 RepID=UPI00053C3969|nr:PREDICTED: putative fasciclin-like arabinogalactan protein 20 [Tarenaya hassleriana]